VDIRPSPKTDVLVRILRCCGILWAMENYDREDDTCWLFACMLVIFTDFSASTVVVG